MSIRQLRISNGEEIRRRMPEFLHKTVQLVLNNSTTVAGKITLVDADGAIVENGRLQRSKFLFSTISEMYFDQNV